MSAQVSWYPAYRFVAEYAAAHSLVLDHDLIAGTPTWCALPDSDARKLLALLLGGVREALANDARQAALADASHEISTAADWSALACRVRAGRGDAYIPREVA